MDNKGEKKQINNLIMMNFEDKLGQKNKGEKQMSANFKFDHYCGGNSHE